jgi:hypothetical protein
MTDTNDPFAQFRRLFEQFGTDSQDVPPALVFPLSPFPTPGVGSGGLSPEDSTKRTIRQLYTALAGVTGNDAGRQITDIWQQYADFFDLDASGTSSTDQIAGAAMTTYRVWFYSLAQMLVEGYTLRLVHDELVVDAHRGTTGTQQWLWTIPQSDREQLLRRCTTVDDELVDEMETARRRRDELLYTFGNWTDAAIDNSLEDAQRYLRVLTGLDDLVTDGTGFSYFPQSVTDDAEDD